MIKSAYIHIPFCRQICSYCDFCKNFYNEKIVNNYLDALDKEIKDNYKKDKLKTIYIGGGTPSCLSMKELDKLFRTINIFKLNKNYEFTFECNYEDITQELLKKLKSNKVNRISIGIETFNSRFEKFLQRNINESKMIQKVNLAKKYFDNINVDLMYALSDESILELKEDLNKIVKLNVNHISIYSLIIEENTKLYINKTSYLKDDIQKNMYDLIYETLKENNYDRYEVSNYSIKGYESKHNLTYWNNDYYYGFGLGASGFVNNVRYTNTKSMKNYINGKKVYYKEKITNDLMIKDEIMLNLRKKSGINKNSFYKKYKKNLTDIININYFKDNKYLIETKNNIYIPKKYFFVQNSIIIEILNLIDIVNL